MFTVGVLVGTVARTHLRSSLAVYNRPTFRRHLQPYGSQDMEYQGFDALGL